MFAYHIFIFFILGTKFPHKKIRKKQTNTQSNQHQNVNRRKVKFFFFFDILHVTEEQYLNKLPFYNYENPMFGSIVCLNYAYLFYSFHISYQVHDLFSRSQFFCFGFGFVVFNGALWFLTLFPSKNLKMVPSTNAQDTFLFVWRTHFIGCQELLSLFIFFYSSTITTQQTVNAHTITHVCIYVIPFCTYVIQSYPEFKMNFSNRMKFHKLDS